MPRSNLRPAFSLAARSPALTPPVIPEKEDNNRPDQLVCEFREKNIVKSVEAHRNHLVLRGSTEGLARRRLFSHQQCTEKLCAPPPRGRKDNSSKEQHIFDILGNTATYFIHGYLPLVLFAFSIILVYTK